MVVPLPYTPPEPRMPLALLHYEVKRTLRYPALFVHQIVEWFEDLSAKARGLCVQWTPPVPSP
jgi:hypothetical protein